MKVLGDNMPMRQKIHLGNSAPGIRYKALRWALHDQYDALFLIRFAENTDNKRCMFKSTKGNAFTLVSTQRINRWDELLVSDIRRTK
jgi:hypothetical protein